MPYRSTTTEKQTPPAHQGELSAPGDGKEVREIANQFQAVFQEALDAILISDDNRVCVEANPAACSLLGRSRDELLGQQLDDFVEAGQKPELELVWERLLEQGQQRGTLRLVHPDEKSREVAYTAKAAMLPGRHLWILHDITERKRADQALLLETTQILLSNLDIRRLLSAISTSTQHVVPHDYASLALYDATSGKLQLQNLDEPFTLKQLPAGLLMPLEGSPAGWAFLNRQPLVLNRLDDDRFLPDIMNGLIALGLKSVCWVPLIDHGRVLGTLHIGTRRDAPFTQREIRLLEQVAGQIAAAINNALAFQQISELKDILAREKDYFEEELRTKYNFEEIIGKSPSFKRVLKQAATVAPTDATVLILGETGTGKELIARAIHNMSARRERTFVKVNCAAIPTGLLESELFGHEKGAFTGAVAPRVGRVELAHRGTLFLDEVGDIPLEIQPKLFRLLQEKEFERLGSPRTISVDIRLIAATNRDLVQMIAERKFRRDLYYRLNVFPIALPPLRERPEDIPLLTSYFVQKYAPRMNKRIQTIPLEAMEALKGWHWPGNVRELENFIERAIILSEGPALYVPSAELRPARETKAAGTTLKETEREHILRVLRETNGVIGGPNGAAARLGLKRTTLNGLMRRLGITRKDI
ncbi:MAG: sigma 54-interacting transcriptional regulator [Acidobacteria bacterium]|nr:sigma 54-interacting transcriptional regulator [Acidobacteriota bacterium]